MISRIPYKIALNTMLWVLSSTLMLHVLILTQIIPYEIVWGGLLNNVQEMIVFELFSIFITLILLITLLLKGGYLKIKISPKLLNVILWVYILLFSLNTVGNLFANTILETLLFTPLTILAAVFCYRITKNRNSEKPKPINPMKSTFLIAVLFSCTMEILPAQNLIIRDINIIDVVNGNVLAPQTVQIKDASIISIGKDLPQTEKEFTVIDGSGKYLIPGLFEMHAHFGQPSWVHMYLHYGITGVRVMAGNDDFLAMRDSLEKTNLPHASLYIVSPLIDGNPPLWKDEHNGPIIESNTDIEPILQEIMEKGYQELKVYNRVPEDQYLKILDLAEKAGLRVSGHLPYTLSHEHFGDPRHHSIEHLDGFVQLADTKDTTNWEDIGLEERFRNSLYSNLDIGSLDGHIKKLKNNQVWVCPTIGLFANMGNDKIKREIMNSPFIDDWAGLLNFWRSMERLSDNFEMKAAKHQGILTVHFLDYADRILAGSDSPNPYNPPGLALHFELYHLSQAGFTNAEVLKIATFNAAKYLGVEDQLGSVAVGKQADLLILNQNPMEDIRHTRDIHQVIKNGIPLAR